jgi:hypothetical protein
MIGVGLAAIPKDTHASPVIYAAFLDGHDEAPTSNGFGVATVTFDLAANSMRVQVTFSNLTTGTTASHIHSPTSAPFTGTAGVATTTPTFPGFPLGVTSGSYDQTFDMSLASSYNPAYIATFPGTGQTQINNAEAALAASLAAGTAYLNIHTTQNPGGEIRGFLEATPEPGTFGLMTIGGVALLLARRRLRAPR